MISIVVTTHLCEGSLIVVPTKWCICLQLDEKGRKDYIDQGRVVLFAELMQFHSFALSKRAYWVT